MNTIATALIISAIVNPPIFTRIAPPPAELRAANAPNDLHQPRTAPPPPPAAPSSSGERQPPEERERTVPPPPPAAPPPPAERRPLPTRNVRVELTIQDQEGSAPLSKKVVSLVIADGRSGNIRSTSEASIGSADGKRNKHLPLYVDATPTVTPDSRVALELRFQYSGMAVITDGTTAVDAPSPARRFTSDLSETLNVLLTPGTPLIVAKSADAASDRIVTVEVKAEILK